MPAIIGSLLSFCLKVFGSFPSTYCRICVRSADVRRAQPGVGAAGAAHAVPPGANRGAGGVVAGGPSARPATHAVSLALWIHPSQVIIVIRLLLFHRVLLQLVKLSSQLCILGLDLGKANKNDVT